MTNESARQKARKKINTNACAVCGSKKKLERHHPDYSKPLKVSVMCRTHHRQWHKEHQAKNKDGSTVFQIRIKPENRELKRQFKIWCAENRKDMSQTIIDLIKNLLS